MSVTAERTRELLAMYQGLKDTILDIDKKYSLNYQEPELNLPPTLDLQPLEYIPKTESELMALATADVTPNHQNKVRSFEQNYLRTKQGLEAKKLHIAETLNQKLVQLLDKYNADVLSLRRRLVNNGLIFSSVVTTKTQETLENYNNQVEQTTSHYETLQDNVDVQLSDLDMRYNQGLQSLDEELDSRVQERYQDLVYREQKDAERIAKYNTALSEKETKYQASCQKALEYARQAEYERALKAAQLYAQLGESGVEAQKISEKYNYCKQFFVSWTKEEALLVIKSDGFLNVHLGSYYNSLIDWVNNNLSA
ncbi:MAG: hypothetical protein IJX23_04790 [Clostridia bacterium]|nr:hypothetical protein [Clostridia bacterium]